MAILLRWLEELLLNFFAPPEQDPKTLPMNQDPAPKPVVVPPAPAPDDWSTVAAARHMVRVICDEKKLPVEQKNDLCGTVGAESGWQSYHLADGVHHKKGDPVKRENIVGGVLWSTDWGICQINDHYHIGPGKDFPSVAYVLSNPRKCIEWMADNWKIPSHRPWWIAFKNGSYRAYLTWPK